MDSDQSLVQQSASGRREAFDELVVRYRRRVYNLVRALTGGDSDAEDLVQDVFIRAYRAIGSFRGDSAFRSWLYRIAINVAHTHIHRRRVRDTVLVAPADGEPVEGTAAGEDVEETLVKRQIIDRALAALPEELRVLVVLRDVQGLKYEEIAEVVKTPRGTVESRLFRARQRLRPMLESLIVARPSDVVGTPPQPDVIAEANGCASAVSADDHDP